jgi:hypothetical protein
MSLAKLTSLCNADQRATAIIERHSMVLPVVVPRGSLMPTPAHVKRAVTGVTVERLLKIRRVTAKRCGRLVDNGRHLKTSVCFIAHDVGAGFPPMMQFDVLNHFPCGTIDSKSWSSVKIVHKPLAGVTELWT